jgi:hypothetical protein
MSGRLTPQPPYPRKRGGVDLRAMPDALEKKKKSPYRESNQDSPDIQPGTSINYRSFFPQPLGGWGAELTTQPPPSAEVKNEWNYISIPHVHLLGADNYFVFVSRKFQSRPRSLWLRTEAFPQ